jgi:hypothetical protein
VPFHYPSGTPPFSFTLKRVRHHRDTSPQGRRLGWPSRACSSCGRREVADSDCQAHALYQSIWWAFVPACRSLICRPATCHDRSAGAFIANRHQARWHAGSKPPARIESSYNTAQRRPKKPVASEHSAARRHQDVISRLVPLGAGTSATDQRQLIFERTTARRSKQSCVTSLRQPTGWGHGCGAPDRSGPLTCARLSAPALVALPGCDAKHLARVGFEQIGKLTHGQTEMEMTRARTHGDG